MAWWQPTTWYEATAGAVGSVYTTGQSAVSSLFASSPQQAATEKAGPYNLYGPWNENTLGIFEPSFGQEVIDYDPSEPYKSRPGNQGCPPGYYTSYDAGGKVCRRYGYEGGKLVGYDPEEARLAARDWSTTVWETVASVADTLAAPVKTAIAGIQSVPWLKGSYVVIGILLAVALVLLMGSRLLSKVERGGA